MGFDYVETMLLGAPTYFWALIPAITCAIISDRWRNMRGPMVAFNSCCVLLGTSSEQSHLFH